MATIDFDSASKTISQLWQCYLEESNGETATVERCFTQLLDLQSKSRVSDGLVLIHYLDFVRRSKGLDDALALFADLVASESDQVTPDVHLYVASCLQWAFSDVKNARIKSSTDTLHVCHSARGKFLTDSTMFAAEFIAFSVGDYRLAVKEAARLLLNRKSTARHQTLWDLWERISGEFGFSVSAKSRKNKARNLKDDIHSENNNDIYNGSFQYTTSRDRSWVHIDGFNNWAGVLYMTPNAPISSGTGFYRFYDGATCKQDMDILENKKEIDKFSQDMTKWKIVDSVGNVFNRLILFNSNRFHMSQDYFGDSKENGRLFQVFFFSTER